MQNALIHANRIELSARVLVRRVVRILKACGISDSKLQNIFDLEVSAAATRVEAQVSPATAQQIIACSDVVLKWRNDSRFVTKEGLPGLLMLQGESANFSELAGSVAPNENPGEVLATLKDLGVVRITDSNLIELISESVVACSGREGSVMASEPILEHICGFLGSVEYNLFDKPSRARGRFERACYASVPDKLVPILESLVSSKGQEFVDVIDEWLDRRAIRPSNVDGTVLVGAGAYVFVRDQVA
jgi:Family of unknown function (DUF6502)